VVSVCEKKNPHEGALGLHDFLEANKAKNKKTLGSEEGFDTLYRKIKELGDEDARWGGQAG
jgi:hypothetical protein